MLNVEKTSQENGNNEKPKGSAYVSKADIRKNMRRARNGPGRNQSLGGRVENSKGFSPESFDRVLLDAPCSALGLRPRLFAGEETIESLRKHAKYQRKMFDQVVQLARPGGVIVYSTCTINPGENEALVRYALDTYMHLSLAPQHPRIGGPGLVGHFEFPDGYVEEWLRPGEEELVQRFDPSSPLDTIGFFIAKFVVRIQRCLIWDKLQLGQYVEARVVVVMHQKSHIRNAKFYQWLLTVQIPLYYYVQRETLLMIFGKHEEIYHNTLLDRANG
ncbi:NOL1/NOP2/sun family protein [Quillaja saponaria]|uniref:NOL1/NOP2/sun family protein n=1 Tax=Quillaja saponaria TaxID=32244 RepID=A0AAD7LVU4_QUISA|nr:NOL1/NOP2/sun family protein [Quillaja saponaria]